MGIGGGLISTPVRYTNRTILDIHDLCEYQEEKLMFVPRPQFFFKFSNFTIKPKNQGGNPTLLSIIWMRDYKCGWDWVLSIVFICLYDILILNCPWPGSDWLEWRVESGVYRTERRSPVKTLLTLLPTSHVRKSDSWRRIPCSHENEYEETCLNQKNLLWKKWDKSGRINYRWLTMMLVYNQCQYYF